MGASYFILISQNSMRNKFNTLDSVFVIFIVYSVDEEELVRLIIK